MLGALLVGLCLAGSPQQARAAGFYDVPSGEWYATWVGQAADKGLMSGYKDARGNLTGWFGPDDPITRAQVATVLWRMAGGEAASGASFPDVGPSDWHYQASAGLRVLMGAYKRSVAAGGSIRVTGTSDEVREVFEITGFTDLFEVA